MKLLKRYGMISLGCGLFAAGFALFLEPGELAPGGVSGIAVLLLHYFPFLDSGTVIFLINLPLLISGAILFGAVFFFGTIWSTLLSSGMISVLSHLVPLPVTTDPLCNAIAGALLVGLGLALVFRENATTGGTDIIVRMIQHRMPHIETGNIFLIVDSSIILLSGLVFHAFEIMVYSGISLYVSMLVFKYIYNPDTEKGNKNP